MKKMVINSCRTAESRKRAITGAVHRLPPIGQPPLTVANRLFSFWMQPICEINNSRRRALISLWLDVSFPGSASLHEKCGHEPERAGCWDSKMHLRIFARTEVNLLPQKTSISCSWCSSFLTLHFFFFKMQTLILAPAENSLACNIIFVHSIAWIWLRLQKSWKTILYNWLGF